MEIIEGPYFEEAEATEAEAFGKTYVRLSLPSDGALFWFEAESKEAVEDYLHQRLEDRYAKAIAK